jgi:hypothetical protein
MPANSRAINGFQIIFAPTPAAELARMPKELQLQILGDFAVFRSKSSALDSRRWARAIMSDCRGAWAHDEFLTSGSLEFSHPQFRRASIQ